MAPGLSIATGPPSVPEIQNNTKNGDAFFADYTVIATISRHF
jgi:hypothetical protein